MVRKYVAWFCKVLGTYTNAHLGKGGVEVEKQSL